MKRRATCSISFLDKPLHSLRLEHGVRIQCQDERFIHARRLFRLAKIRLQEELQDVPEAHTCLIRKRPYVDVKKKITTNCTVLASLRYCVEYRIVKGF